MRRRSFIAVVASALAFPGRGALAVMTRMTVYRDPACGCCHEWSKAMAAAGFSVDAQDTDDLAAIKARLGVPADLEGCHTAVIEEYYLEGHVPLASVQQLLQERPPLRGLAVPGMPSGSLGMGEDWRAPHDVYAIPSGDEAPYVFAEVRPGKG